MLYHYSSKASLDSILRGSPLERRGGVRAIRLDCLGDHEEYKVGIEKIRCLLPIIEADILTDRQVIQLFDWNEIGNNKPCFWLYMIFLQVHLITITYWKNMRTRAMELCLNLMMYKVCCSIKALSVVVKIDFISSR